MNRDVDVEQSSKSLTDKRVILGITGGIAACESVRIAREIRRHGAVPDVYMTDSATRIISKLAVEWGAQSKVLNEWTSEMSQLEAVDSILVCPASRNFIARFVNGMMDHPLLMACSSARSRNIPILLVPSMHNDLFNDPVTEDLCEKARQLGATIILGQNEEGRIKQPAPKQVVSELCHYTNKNTDSKHIAITLGANRAPIDAVRAIQNASSGYTGWRIAEFLYRQGHDITCIAGKTSSEPEFELPNIIRAGEPNQMLQACLDVATTSPDAWVHAAAVLDYFAKPIKSKKKSGSEGWNLTLDPGPKHILELSNHIGKAKRIGFKLETQVGLEQLKAKALEQIESYGVDATIANLMEEMHNPDTPRGYIVTPDGEMNALQNILHLCESIEHIIIN